MSLTGQEISKPKFEGEGNGGRDSRSSRMTKHDMWMAQQLSSTKRLCDRGMTGIRKSFFKAQQDERL